MAVIEVNYTELCQTAAEITAYVARVKLCMNRVDDEISNLAAYWIGDDYDQFRREASEKTSKGSVTDKMLTSMANYSDALREAADLYREAQTRAINRANALCK